MKTGGVHSFIWMNSHEGDILLVTTMQVPTSNFQLFSGSMQMFVLPSPPSSKWVHANVCAALNKTSHHQQHKGPCKWLCCPPHVYSLLHSPITSMLQTPANPVCPSGSLCVAPPVTKVTNYLILKLIKLSCNLVNHTLIHSSNNPHPKSTSNPSSYHQGWLSGWSSWLALDHPHLC